MKRKPFRGKYCLACLFLLILGLSPLGSLELVLNGSTWRVYGQEALEALAFSPGEGERVLPLQELYPWVQEIQSLDAASGRNRIFWEEENFLDWDSARLVQRGDTWELRQGRDVFSRPDRIHLKGTLIPVSQVVVWDSTGDQGLEEELRDGLTLRGVELIWKQVMHLERSLRMSRPEDLPDLLILEAPAFLALTEALRPLPPLPPALSLGARQAFSQGKEDSAPRAWPLRGTTWTVVYDPEAFTPGSPEPQDLVPGLSPAPRDEGIPAPWVWDARRLEPLLAFLPQGPGSLFPQEDSPLPPKALEILAAWSRAKASGTLLAEENPAAVLAAGGGAGGILPSPQASLFLKQHPGWKTHPLPFFPLSYQGAAVPSASSRPGISQLLLKELTSLSAQSRLYRGGGNFPVFSSPGGAEDLLLREAREQGLPFPRTSREEALNQAYTRVGRLILSGQISPLQGQETLIQAVNTPVP